MQTVLTIAGFDPSSGAGVTADLMVFAAHGLFGTSCITNLTVQSTVGVLATHAISGGIVRETLKCLASDLPMAGIKIGMLSDLLTVEAVVEFIAGLRHAKIAIPIVLDPVIRSSSGRELLTAEGIGVMRSQLLPLVDWVTPNLDELAVLADKSVRTLDDLLPAARQLQQLGANLNIVATAGHLDPPDDLLLTSDGTAYWLPGRHIESRSTHGTGCAFSSALLSRLVLGDAAHPAAISAKEYVAGAIRSASPLGRGKGPLNLLWRL